LRDATHSFAFDSVKVDAVILELKSLIKEYEQNMVFARSPYPGEILLGTTPPGHSTKLETLCSTRYDGLLKEIRIRRTGRGGSYLRIKEDHRRRSSTKTAGSSSITARYSDSLCPDP